MNIFVIGVGRSGTSLLQSMLNSHINITFLPETQFLRKHVLKNSISFFKNDKFRQNFIRKLHEDDRFIRIGVDPNFITKEANSPLEAYEQLLKLKIANDVFYVGDKDPRFIDFIPELYKLIPNSKIIHIIRDPRDVVLSRTKADWSKHWPFFLHGCMYRAQLERGRKFGNEIYGDNYWELYYENLIDQPVHELTQICDFLGIGYSEAMLDFGKSARKLVDEREMQWKKETLGPLLQNNTQKWRKELSGEQVYYVQEMCRDTFIKHPYRKEPISVSFSVKLKGLVYSACSALFSLLYPIRVKFIK